VADIFISYTSSDRDWAFWIATELKTLGHTPHVHEWEIEGGGDIYAWMEQRHDAADHVLCVVSDEYLKAPYSTLERNAAIWQAVGKRPGFALFVAVKPCKLPTLADHIRRCELFGIPEEAARLRFSEFMQKREAPTTAFPGKVFAVSNIPIRIPKHFLGREDSLAAIAEALDRFEGRVAVTALYGLRGVGKSTLAAAYSERRRGEYRATWWVRAQTPSSMRADLVGLGVRLGWVSADEKEAPALAIVMERLRHEGEGILLIYDNAIEPSTLKPYLPRGGAARVLITSNAHAWRGVASPVEIRLWPTDIGADYLIARTGRDEERFAAVALSEALGGLPLAHEQAAAYCERLEVPFAEYRKRLQAAPAKLLDTGRDAPAEYHDRLTVAKTFSLAIDEAAKLHPAAEALIIHAALLAPEPVPLFLFADGREKFGEPLASSLADDGLDEAVAALRAFALVDREVISDEREPVITTDCLRLHRLVHLIARARSDEAVRAQVQRTLLEAFVTLYPDDYDIWSDTKIWPRLRRLDALTLAMVEGEDALPAGAEKQIATLLSVLAEYRYWALGAVREAHPLIERALAIRENVLGPEHPDTAATLNIAATLIQAQGDYKAAQPLFERALAIREKGLGPEHPKTATSLNNLAVLLQRQGNLKEALPLRYRALAVFEKTLGPEHFRTANNLNNLALLLQAQGDLAGAEPIMERALAIREKVLGPEHPHTAQSLNCLGNLRRAKGDLPGARPLFERALAIDEKVLGSGHPTTAGDVNNLAMLLQAQGDLEVARALFQRALETWETMFGPEHPQTALGLHNLGKSHQKLGNLAEAHLLYERALLVWQKTLGSEHPNTNRAQQNFASLLLAKGNPAEALTRSKPALVAHEKALGANHPWTKESAGVTADALDALGQGAEAAALREKYGIVLQ
jgi:tetratricopeptide (TPR) repeat protein